MKLTAIIIWTLLASIPWTARADTVSWTCVPQQILIGEWKIEIQASQNGIYGTTSYAPEIFPGMSPIVQTIPLSEAIGSNSLAYTGADFQMIIFPERVPESNPFYPPDGAVAAEAMNIQFSSNATLKNQAYACQVAASQSAAALHAEDSISTELQSTFSSIQNNILIPKCAGCHGPGGTAKFVPITNYAFLVQAKLLVPGAPDQSVLYNSVSQLKMPPKNPLAQDEISAIATWISNGAMDN